MQAYVKTDATECPVQLIDEYRVEGGTPVVVAVIAGYPGYRAVTVPTSDVVFR